MGLGKKKKKWGDVNDASLLFLLHSCVYMLCCCCCCRFQPKGEGPKSWDRAPGFRASYGLSLVRWELQLGADVSSIPPPSPYVDTIKAEWAVISGNSMMWLVDKMCESIQVNV